MFDLDSFEEILSTMRRNAMRTTLTAVGVFWGVFLLVIMVGFGNGLEAGAQKSMRGVATNSLYIWGQRTSVPHAGLTPGRFVKLQLDDAVALRQVPGVAVAAPRVTLGGRRTANLVSRGDKSGPFTVMGDTPEYLRIEPLRIDGRFINKLDMDQRRKVAVIGETVVELLFAKDEEPIGELITVAGTDFMVVGVFATDKTGDEGDRHASTVYTPLTTFQQALQSDTRIDYIAVLSEADTRASVVEKELSRILKKRHRAAPDDMEAIGSWNADEQFRKVQSLFTGISVLIYIVAFATLIAGLVGVSNIMLVSVRERTRELGIRKAVGATPRTVIAQVVTESVVLSSIAGYLGLVAGVGLIELIARTVDFEKSSGFDAPSVTLETAIMAAVAVAVGGAVAGLFPALHAARIRTVTALRSE